MVQFNFSERTIKAKVVYYGPPQSGKTTNLEQIHRITDPEGSNRLISLNTAQDRTLFFDLLPFSLGTVSGYDFKIQLYTVPGQVQYNATRRVVLAGADAVVFVADSHQAMARENLTAFENMKVNLLANRLVPEKVPLVLQYNKQDLEPLVPRADLERALNPWGRRSFPAVAARGDGVMETFAAIVQEMLAAIAVKYNLKEKGLDPQAVPEIISQAFAALLRRVPGPPPAPSPPVPSPPPPPPRVVIAQPEGAEPAYPGQAGPEGGPVSEELLHRAIRSNVELAEALGQVIRDLSLGLRTIHAHADQLVAAGGDSPPAAAAAAIQREARRLHLLLRNVGQAAATRSGGTGRAPAPPQVPPTPPRGTTPAPPPPRRPVPPARPPAPALPAAPAPPPAAPGPAHAVPSTLDALVAEAVHALRGTLAARPLRVESRIPPGAPLPRCSPAGLRRAVVRLIQGLAAVVAPATGLLLRAERKPVLLRGRDGSEAKRDFLMLALTHASGLAEADQQRVLKGTDTGPLGEAHRLVREMGGFVRFAPLPGGALETRVFLPA
jgi:signal recognition particle receptor subunit beta